MEENTDKGYHFHKIFASGSFGISKLFLINIQLIKRRKFDSIRTEIDMEK